MTVSTRLLERTITDPKRPEPIRRAALARLTALSPQKGAPA